MTTLNRRHQRTGPLRGSHAIALSTALVSASLLFAQPVGFVERHWYDGTRQRTVWMAPNEVAVVFDPAAAPKTRSDAEHRVARSTPGAVLEKQRGPVSIFRLPEGTGPEKRARALRTENSVRHASPVFYEGSIGPENALILSGEIIVGFTAAMGGDALAVFAGKYGVRLVGRLDALPDMYVFDARSAGDSLTLANTIFESGQVALAQPNWIKNATRR